MNTNFNIIPLDDHHRNLSEKDIKIWKDHFICVIIGMAAAFPAQLWYQAILQAETQLLLLWQSNVNPKISAYAHVYGPHYYNAEPFVPIVMDTLVHNRPNMGGALA